MKNILLIILIFSALLLNACSSKKNDRDLRIILDKEYKEEIVQSRDLLRTHLVTNKTAITVSVSVAGQTVWSEGMGFSNLELKSPAFPEHKYRIGTMSGLLTSMLVLKLQEEGKLDVNKKYTDYITENVNKDWDFSLYNLSCHLSGLQPDRLIDELISEKYQNMDSLIDAHKNDKQLYPINTTKLESSLGICMLAKVAEYVTKDTYQRLVKEKIFNPLNLNETLVELPNVIIENKATCYARDMIARLFLMPSVNINVVSPALGIISTADDLNRLGQAIMNKELLSENSYKLLLQPNVASQNNYFTGIAEYTDNMQRSFYMVAGAVPGGSSLLVIYPEQQLVISMCSNLLDDFTSYQFMEIVETFVSKVAKNEK